MAIRIAPNLHGDHVFPDRFPKLHMPVEAFGGDFRQTGVDHQFHVKIGIAAEQRLQHRMARIF